MRVFCKETKRLMGVVCNGCGQEIWKGEVEDARRDYVSVDKTWGYFSHKDGESHHFDLCEACYDKWIHAFRIPVEMEQETELL